MISVRIGIHGWRSACLASTTGYWRTWGNRRSVQAGAGLDHPVRVMLRSARGTAEGDRCEAIRTADKSSQTKVSSRARIVLDDL